VLGELWLTTLFEWSLTYLKLLLCTTLQDGLGMHVVRSVKLVAIN